MKKILTYTIITCSIFLHGCVEPETKKVEEKTNYFQYKKSANYLQKENFYEPTLYPDIIFYGCEVELDSKMINITSMGMVKFEQNKIDFYNPTYSMPTLSFNDKDLYEQFKKEWVYRRNVCSFQQEHGA